MRIGIFDTGHGGVLVAQRLRKLLPQHDYLVADDKEWMPYGNRSPMAIAHLTDKAIQPLLANKCDVIVLACNTATAAAIDYLRQRYPDQQFVGYEPMVKPAAKRVAAAQSSTGEQKAMLVAITLAHAALAAQGRAGVLLLDEVAAHLDPLRRAALFDQLADSGAQVWMTGTEIAPFESVAGAAATWRVDGGRVTRV